MFVSERPGEGTCNSGPGFGDIYIIRRNAAVGWGEPRHLGCVETGTGPNSAGAEFSPSLVSTEEGTFLYFSSTASGNHDIYRSRRQHDGSFGPPTPVRELNTEFDDRMPNVSADGLEIVFSSDRHSRRARQRDVRKLRCLCVAAKQHQEEVVGPGQSRSQREHCGQRNALRHSRGTAGACISAATVTSIEQQDPGAQLLRDRLVGRAGGPASRTPG